MGKFVSKLRALLKAPLFYISVAATAAVAAVACCTVLFWSSPKQSPKNPALTAEQKLFLQQIAETTSQQPTTVEFSCDVSAALAEDEQITEVHHVSESFVVVTIQKTETDGETVISTTTTIEIIENNNGTAAKVAGLNYPVKNSAGLGYSFVSCDGTNIVLSCTQNIQNVGQKTSQVLISSNGTSLIGANAYDEIVCLPSNTLLLLNHSDVDNDGIPDDEDVFDVNFAKISGSTITVGEHIRYVMGYEVVENFIAINSLDKFSVYFINNLPTEVFTIASSAEGKSIQELIDEGFNLLVQDFKVEQINSNLYYINQTLTGSEQDYTTKRDYGNVVMYYKNANYIVNAKSQSVNAMTDQTSTFSYKVLANDCYEQTKTAPNGKSTTTYFNASG